MKKLFLFLVVCFFASLVSCDSDANHLYYVDGLILTDDDGGGGEGSSTIFFPSDKFDYKITEENVSYIVSYDLEQSPQVKIKDIKFFSSLPSLTNYSLNTSYISDESYNNSGQLIKFTVNVQYYEKNRLSPNDAWPSVGISRISKRIFKKNGNIILPKP